KMLPKIIEQLRENGKQIDVVVIETIQKLRDITMDDIMDGKLKKPTFNEWGECASRIVSIYRYISKLQEHYQFHLAISGHEGINKDKDDEGSTINPTITIEAQDQIKKAVISQSDVLARMTIEEHEQDGEKTYQYVLNAEPSNLFETKIRHSSNIKINNKRFINPSINDVVQAIRNGN
ncbi:TPA: AAA family ATPase, partial [Staphylococcus aureus]|nr:AAA family ATPase [Staphylococcus aureus]